MRESEFQAFWNAQELRYARFVDRARRRARKIYKPIPAEMKQEIERVVNSVTVRLMDKTGG